MVFLIDYENVSNEGLVGIENLSEKDRLILFYSKNANSITISMHRKLEDSPVKKEYIEITCTGKNALDFQLSTYLGYIVFENKKEQFAIISKDEGFNSIIEFWKSKEINIARYENLTKKEKSTTKEKSASKKELSHILSSYTKDIDEIMNIINDCQSKQAINNELVKKYNSQKAGVIYKAIKPMLKNKTGK